MLLMIEKCISGGLYNVIHLRARAINKEMNDYDKNKE